jgi:flagellar hook-length control protein FliK
MGFLFQNVNQLAGFLINDAGNTPKNVNANGEKADGNNFQAILESVSDKQTVIRESDPEKGTDDIAYLETLLNANFPSVAGVNPLAESGLEIKERAGINADLLTVLVTNQKDSITLNLSGKALAKLAIQTADGNPLEMNNASPDNSYGVSVNLKQMLKANLYGDKPQSANLAQIGIANRISDGPLNGILFDATEDKFVKVSDMLQTLREYPDPIDIEIGDLADGILASDSSDAGNPKLLSSSFKFDLRDLLNAAPQEKVHGILTTAEKSLANVVYNSKNMTVETGLKNSGLHIEFDEIKSPILFDPAQPQIVKGEDSTVSTKLANLPMSETGSNTKPLTNWFVNGSPNPKNGQSDKDQPGLTLAKGKTGPQSAETKNPQVSSKETHKEDKSSTVPAESSAGSTTVSDKQANFGVSAGLPDTVGDDLNLIRDTRPSMPQTSANDDDRIASNIRDIKNAILDAFEQKNGYIKIRLHPENLGEVSIHLLWKEDGLTVHMRADNKESHKILTAGAADLKGNLEAANFRVNEVNVSTQSDWDGKALQNGGQQMAGEHKQSRQQNESMDESISQGSNNWDSDETAEDSANRQKGSNWVDLKA